MGSGSIAEDDGGTLLNEIQTRIFHDRTESQEGGGHAPTHSRQLSINSTSDVIIQKLRVFLSGDLIDQVKTLLREELKNIDVVYWKNWKNYY